MRIRSYDAVARAHKPLLRQKRVLDADCSDIVKMRDAVLFGELASCYAKLRRLYILARSVVMGPKEFYFLRIKARTTAMPILKGQGRRAVSAFLSSSRIAIFCGQ